MPLRPKLSFTAMSTALLLSTVALPVSVIAFAVLYANNDSFWPVLWLGALLPTIWVAAAALSIRDAIKGRSWRQVAGVVALLAPTALLVHTMLSPRFLERQLFSFRPLTTPSLPTTGFVFMQMFTVCAQGSPCSSHDAVTATQTFRLAKVPDGCCSLQVINGQGAKHKVEAFHVVLNGKEVKLPTGDALQVAVVELSTENKISVETTGAPDARIYVFISHTIKRDAPPT